jgi:GNAT superfamily N-acetyltransferase
MTDAGGEWAWLRVGRATAADVPVILALIRELAAFESSTATTTEAALLRDGFGATPRFHVVLAHWGEAPIGFAFYAFTYSTYRGAPVLFLEDLYVRPAFRGRGVGRALMAVLAQEAEREGCARFVWEVLEWNAKAIEFYASLGAEVKRERMMTWLQGDALARLARQRAQ